MHVKTPSPCALLTPWKNKDREIRYYDIGLCAQQKEKMLSPQTRLVLFVYFNHQRKWGCPGGRVVSKCVLRKHSIHLALHCVIIKSNLNMLQRERYTLPGHNETGYAVWDAGACRQESDAHDDIRDSQSVANYSHLREIYTVWELSS